MYTFGPIAVAVGLAYAVVTALTTLFTPVAGAAAAALAVVGLTLAVRAALLPLSYAQVRGERSRARLAPQLRTLQEKHGSDPERLRTEMQRLYTAEGTSPLAGCLPMLAQAPVFVAVYGVFVSASVSGEPNALLAHTLGGARLGSSLVDALGAGSPGQVLVFALVMLAIAAVAAVSRYALVLPAQRQAAADGGPALPGARVLSYLPFLTVAIAAFAPLAAGLYLVASTAWTLAERVVLRRLTAE